MARAAFVTSLLFRDGLAGFTALFELLLGGGTGFCLRGIGAFKTFLGDGAAARGIGDESRVGIGDGFVAGSTDPR